MTVIIDEIKSKIAEGNLLTAIQTALDHFKSVDSSIYDKLIIISSKYKELENDKIKGIIPYAEDEIRRNSIKDNLLNLIAELDKDFSELEKYKKEKVGKIELFDDDAIFIGVHGVHGHELVKVKISSILYIKAESGCSLIFLENGKKRVITKTLKSVEEILPKRKFLRINRSFIVSTKKIQKISRGYVVIEGVEIALLGKMRQELLKEIKRI